MSDDKGFGKSIKWNYYTVDHSYVQVCGAVILENMNIKQFNLMSRQVKENF